MQHYLLRNLSDLAQKRAVLMREEAQLWDVLARDLTREAKRLDEAAARPGVRATPPVQPPTQVVPAERKILVGIGEAAKMIGVGRSTLYAMIAGSQIKARKAGHQTLIAVSDIEEWCRNLPERPA